MTSEILSILSPLEAEEDNVTLGDDRQRNNISSAILCLHWYPGCGASTGRLTFMEESRMGSTSFHISLSGHEAGTFALCSNIRSASVFCLPCP